MEKYIDNLNLQKFINERYDDLVVAVALPGFWIAVFKNLKSWNFWLLKMASAQIIAVDNTSNVNYFGFHVWNLIILCSIIVTIMQSASLQKLSMTVLEGRSNYHEKGSE